MAYDTFQTLPAFTRAIWEGDKLMNPEAPTRWSNAAPPPAIGTRITITMNRLGPATVTGYFAEDGWLGLLVTLHDAPDWHRKQRNGDNRGHIFGPEFKLA